MHKKRKMVIDGTLVISEESLRPLFFFNDLYCNRQLFNEEDKINIRVHLFDFCTLLFWNDELMDFIDAQDDFLRENVEHDNILGLGRAAARKSVDTVMRLRYFYDINKRSPVLRDKRVTLLLDLKKRVLCMMQYLKRCLVPRIPDIVVVKRGWQPPSKRSVRPSVYRK